LFRCTGVVQLYNWSSRIGVQQLYRAIKVHEYNRGIAVVQCYKIRTVVKMYRSTTGFRLMYRDTREVEE
jgi:hypothetical protein